METREITQAIKEARPKLSVISPLVAKIVLGFAVLNLLLGAGLASTSALPSTPLIVAPTSLAYQIWGAAFFVLGLIMFWAYKRNNWKIIRYTFVLGMCFKFAWAIALAVRYFSGDFGNPLVLIIWLFIAYVQAASYIHFMPIPQIQKGAEDADK